MKRSLIAVAAVVALFAGSARAAELTPEQKEQRDYVQGQMNDDIDLANSACGAKMSIALNWDSLKGQDTSDKSLRDYCAGAPVSAMRNYCSEGEAQKARVRKIKKVQCSFSSAEPSAFTVAGDTAKYVFSWSLDGAEEAVRKGLTK